MFKIFFKDVGQGDSIILEWRDGDQNKIGFIDCNLKKNSENPSLNHLIKSDFKEIEFIILSHPHRDHFAGMKQLLEYCALSNIHINSFCHTSFQDFKYLKSSVVGVTMTQELGQLFKTIKSLTYDSKLIRAEKYIMRGCNPIAISSDIKLQFLLPTEDEYNKFQKRAYIDADEDQYSSSVGNWLSTFIKIESNEWYILLSSDCEAGSIKKLGYDHDNEDHRHFKGNLILAQSPHHGSKKNHVKIFWRNRYHPKNTPIVFSVGENIYGHPSTEVVKNFRQSGYEIFSTNYTGGLMESVSTSTPSANNKIRGLRVIGRKVTDSMLNSKLSGEKIFELASNKVDYKSIK